MEDDLKQRVLRLLRDKRMSDGDCYHGVDNLAKELGCTAGELFDRDTDTGVLQALSDEGDIQVLGGRDAIAVLDDPWD